MAIRPLTSGSSYTHSPLANQWVAVPDNYCAPMYHPTKLNYLLLCTSNAIKRHMTLNAFVIFSSFSGHIKTKTITTAHMARGQREDHSSYFIFVICIICTRLLGTQIKTPESNKVVSSTSHQGSWHYSQNLHAQTIDQDYVCGE